MPNTTYGTPYAQSSDLVSNWPGVSLNVADRLDDVSFKGNGLNDQTGTTYTLVLTDAGKTVTLNNASAVTVTVPTNASVAYETGTCIYFTNKGAGVVTISAAGGVTLNNSSTLAQYASCYIQKLDTNTWVMVSAPAAGLTLVASSTFSAVSSVSVNNCFTSTYENYRVIIDISAVSTTATVGWRMRVSGTDNTTSNYVVQQMYNSSTTAVAAAQTTSDRWDLGTLETTNDEYVRFSFDVYGPQVSRFTTATGLVSFANASVTTFGVTASSHFFKATTQFDGMSLFTSTGTVSGSVRIYGYRNS